MCEEHKIIINYNPGYNSTKTIDVHGQVKLTRISTFTPALNPAEKLWDYLKHRFKNKAFGDIKELKK